MTLKAGSTRYPLSFPPGLQERAERAAEADGRSLNNWIIRLITSALKKEGSEMTKMQAHEAWEGFVGSQTPAEFMVLSAEKGVHGVTAACSAYVQDIPSMFGHSYTDDELQDIAVLLAQYIQENAWVRDMVKLVIGRPADPVTNMYDWQGCWPCIDEFGNIHDVIMGDVNPPELEARGITFDEAADCYRIDLGRNR